MYHRRDIQSPKIQFQGNRNIQFCAYSGSVRVGLSFRQKDPYLGFQRQFARFPQFCDQTPTV